MFHLNASHLEEYQTKQYILRLEVCGREEGGKFTFRISHDEFRMSLEKSNCGYSFKITLSFLSENYYTDAAKIIKKTSRSPAAQHSKLTQARVTYTKALAMDAFTVEGCLLA